jgi:hypothetical protein
MYFTIERLAAERVADFRREVERSGPGGPRGMPPLVRSLLRWFRGVRARVGWAAVPIRSGRPAANPGGRVRPADHG